MKMLDRIARVFDGAYWHWKNETGKGRPPWHGRAWLHLTDRWGLRFEWALGKTKLGIGASIDRDEREFDAFVQLPLASLYLGLRTPLVPAYRRGEPSDREVSLRIFDSSVYWNLGLDPDDLREDDGWRRGSLDLARLLLGERRVAEETRKEGLRVPIPLPEGVYPGIVRLYQVRTWRDRLPSLTTELELRAEVSLDEDELARRGWKPPLFPGKGENAWDVDDDVIVRLNVEARHEADAVAAYVGRVLTYRLGRAGILVYPAPVSA